MGANLTLTGTLVEGPQLASDDAFPSGVTSIPFELNTGDCPKPVQASTGRQLVTLASPSAYVQLSGVGAGQSVTQAATVYMRVRSGAFLFRVTYNATPTPIVSVLPSAGLFIHEADVGSASWITKLEVQGQGVIEFYASGQQ